MPLPGVDGPVLELAVRDTGLGIRPDNLDRLFQPFTQEDASTSRKYGGTGLGLAICRLIVERLSGTIEVESRLGEGSTFLVRLPLVTTVPSSGRSRPAPTAYGDVSDLRVLLADDDEVNQKVARHMLGRLGITPVVVGDGDQAVRAVLTQEFDVVLMDVHMPGTDGVEATHRLHEHLAPHERPWVIAVTANALEGDREKLLSHGMDAYLSKPVQLEALHHQLALARVASGAAPLPGPVTTERAEGPAEAVAGPTGEPDRLLEPADPDAFAGRTGLEDEELYAALLRELSALATRLSAHDGGRDRAALRIDATTLLGAASTSAAPALVQASRALREACLSDADLEEAMGRVRREGSRLRAWVERRPAPI